MILRHLALITRGREDVQMPVETVERVRTRTADIAETLRTAIMNARLKPGERLRFEELREQFDAGMSPLREALTRLAGDGLVTFEENKGYRVASVSREDLIDLVEVRASIEAMAIARAIKNGTDAWEGRILATLHELGKRSKLTKDGDIDFHWEEVHERFHLSLVADCQSPRLLHFRNMLANQATRYRRLSVHYLSVPRDDLGEHRALAEAVIARRIDDADYLIRKHYIQTVETLLAKAPELFAGAEDEGAQVATA
ncbi:FCD domain-containing protein [Corticibacterium sp. UT-5YL-CI-8]|nr:FCD domain-containing protein [Tianweitania sp. UT-5YL-CI-8]